MVEEPRGPVIPEREIIRAEEERVQPPPPPPAPTSALAIASLATGISAWVIFPVVGAIAAVVTGALALNEINAGKGRVVGAPFATAGIVLGGVQLGLVIIAVILGVIFAGIVGPGFRAALPVAMTLGF